MLQTTELHFRQWHDNVLSFKLIAKCYLFTTGGLDHNAVKNGRLVMVLSGIVRSNVQSWYDLSTITALSIPVYYIMGKKKLSVSPSLYICALWFSHRPLTQSTSNLGVFSILNCKRHLLSPWQPQFLLNCDTAFWRCPRWYHKKSRTGLTGTSFYWKSITTCIQLSQ